jgi:hypothetical protein
MVSNPASPFGLLVAPPATHDDTPGFGETRPMLYRSEAFAEDLDSLLVAAPEAAPGAGPAARRLRPAASLLSIALLGAAGFGAVVYGSGLFGA